MAFAIPDTQYRPTRQTKLRYSNLPLPFWVDLEPAPPGDGVVDLSDLPNPFGLSGALLYARLLHPRALGGRDIRFARTVLRRKQGDVATALGVKQETLSRIENGMTQIGSSSEKLFRIFALQAANAHFGVHEHVAKSVLDECFALVFADQQASRGAGAEGDLSFNLALQGGLWRRVPGN